MIAITVHLIDTWIERRLPHPRNAPRPVRHRPAGIPASRPRRRRRRNPAEAERDQAPPEMRDILAEQPGQGGGAEQGQAGGDDARRAEAGDQPAAKKLGPYMATTRWLAARLRRSKDFANSCADARLRPAG